MNTPQQANATTAARPYTEQDIGTTHLMPTYRVDLRPDGKDVFYDADPVSDWQALSWKRIGRPYRVERWSKEKQSWEKEHGQELPPKTSWEMFNRSFQRLFDEDATVQRKEALSTLGSSLGKVNLHEAWEAVEDIVQASIWNKVHRVEDAIWDPRGKRALFEGLDVEKPEVLFLGAADGYEAMQLMAMYPGGHAVLVDYDDYCRTHRFGEFPEAYPFLGTNPATGAPKVWYRDEMNIDFEVADIRDLKY
jgi:hypothetical protein